jgi:hypothetical protein
MGELRNWRMGELGDRGMGGLGNLGIGGLGIGNWKLESLCNMHCSNA